MSLNHLYNEAQKIQSFLEITVSDNPNELFERLSMINVYLARTGKMLAEVRGIQDRSISLLFKQHPEIAEMPATIAKSYISSQTADAGELSTWIERINRTCVHQADNLRTLISYTKEQLRLTKTGY